MEGERGVWLMWCQSIVELRWAVWLDWIVHTEWFGNLWRVCVCVCVKYKRPLPCSLLVVAALFFCCFLPIIRMSTALKMAGGGRTVCVCVSSLLCHLFFLINTLLFPVSLLCKRWFQCFWRCHFLCWNISSRAAYQRCSRLLALPVQSSCFAFQMRNLCLTCKWKDLNYAFTAGMAEEMPSAPAEPAVWVVCGTNRHGLYYLGCLEGGSGRTTPGYGTLKRLRCSKGPVKS